MPGPDPSLVRHFPFFRSLGDEDLRAVLAAAQNAAHRSEKRRSLSRARSAGEFFVLLHGHLKVLQTTPDGRQVIVRIVEPGELYGIAVALGRPDYPATAVAMEESHHPCLALLGVGLARRACAAAGRRML